MLKSKNNFLYALLISTLICADCYAQELMGEVKIEEFSKNPAGAYLDQQTAALNFVQNVEDSFTSGSAKGELLADNKVGFYLTGLYLYCLKKSGSCPFALDTILVSDYYLNKQNQQGCQNMKNLWRSWVENGYEKRIAYLIPLALSQKFSDFQQNKRPRYLRCDETLKTFKPDQESLKSIKMTKRFIEQIKEKNINILAESGAVSQKDSEFKSQKDSAFKSKSR